MAVTNCIFYCVVAICVALVAIAEKFARLTESLPTADVEEVKHGYWATDEEDIYWGNSLKRKHCSVCKARPFFDEEKREFILTDYCSDCGAKMDGGKANDREL